MYLVRRLQKYQNPSVRMTLNNIFIAAARELLLVNILIL